MSKTDRARLLKKIQVPDPAAYDGVNLSLGDWTTPQVPRGRIWKFSEGSLRSQMTAAVAARTALIQAVDAGGALLGACGYGTVASDLRIAHMLYGIGGATNPPPLPAFSNPAWLNRPWVPEGGRIFATLVNAQNGDKFFNVTLYVWEFDADDWEAILAFGGT